MKELEKVIHRWSLSGHIIKSRGDIKHIEDKVRNFSISTPFTKEALCNILYYCADHEIQPNIALDMLSFIISYSMMYYKTIDDSLNYFMKLTEIIQQRNNK